MSEEITAGLISAAIGAVATIGAALLTRSGSAPAQSIVNNGTVYGNVATSQSTQVTINQHIDESPRPRTTASGEEDTWVLMGMTLLGALFVGLQTLAWTSVVGGLLTGALIGALITLFSATRASSSTGFRPARAFASYWLTSAAVTSTVVWWIHLHTASVGSLSIEELRRATEESTHNALASASNVGERITAVLTGPFAAISHDTTEQAWKLAMAVALSTAATAMLIVFAWLESLQWSAAARLASGGTSAKWKVRMATAFMSSSDSRQPGLAFVSLILLAISCGGMTWVLGILPFG